MWTFYVRISFENGVNFSELKCWTKIPEGENIAKQIEIGVNESIKHILGH